MGERNNIFKEEIHILHPGEYYATKNNNILGTLTSSSIVVCLYDKELGIGGMGHFIVPGTIGTKGIVADEIARVGVANMEYLMGEIVKLGGDRKRLEVKVFGSGSSSTDDARINEVVRGNIKFINQYFRMENIEIKEESLGGNKKRKILFNPMTGDVKMEVVDENDVSDFLKLEAEYIDKVFKNKDKTGEVIIFD